LSHFAGRDVEVLNGQPGSLGDIAGALGPDVACVVVQNPDVYGQVHDLTPLAEAVHEAGALLIVVFTEVFSLGAIRSPGEMGADIVVGEGQGIGNALNFGGPYLGLFACRQKFVRQLPGRICGQTVDAGGKRGFVLTLSTREQHIRREKATSNICTNSGLCALAFSIHMALLGEAGLRKVASHCHANAVRLADRLAHVPGVALVTDRFFNEFTLALPKKGADVIDALAARNVLGGVALSRLAPARADLENLIVVATTETNTDDDIAAFEAALREVV
ncbi:MAG: glycine dehydrogenase, partial [Hyphomicrobiales bacterium]